MKRCCQKWKDETGSEVVEFGLVLLPLLAVMFLLMDIAWIVFAQATLQHAVQVGVRSAATGYLPSGQTGLNGYVKSVVQQSAMGFLDNADANEISVNYYNPSDLSKTVTGAGSTAGGNVVEVVVQNVPVKMLGPIWGGTWSTILLTARSSDVMESSPNPPMP